MAFEAYEEAMHPLVANAQKLPPAMPHLIHPQSTRGVWVLRILVAAIYWSGVGTLLFKWKGPPASVVKLKEYGLLDEKDSDVYDNGSDDKDDGDDDKGGDSNGKDVSPKPDDKPGNSDESAEDEPETKDDSEKDDSSKTDEDPDKKDESDGKPGSEEKAEPETKDESEQKDSPNGDSAKSPKGYGYKNPMSFFNGSSVPTLPEAAQTLRNSAKGYAKNFRSLFITTNRVVAKTERKTISPWKHSGITS
ncbi:hypothetical protein D6C83_07738, partial [Aureobasidium pullulans]